MSDKDKSISNKFLTKVDDCLTKLSESAYTDKNDIKKVIIKKYSELKELEYIEERTLEETELMMELSFELGEIFGNIRMASWIGEASKIYII